MSKQLRGDEGLTDLLDARDIPKSDLRFEVLGTLDEASSALGVVRANNPQPDTKDLILELQSDLCWMMSELATLSIEQVPETHITTDRLELLEKAFHELTAAHPPSSTFIAPGDSMVGALLHLARSIVRRAERHVALLNIQAPLPNQNIIPYLNRLSTLLFAMARAEEANLGIPNPTVARLPECGL
jgi:cob(I)alamin adenosyltransferase